MDRTLEKKIDRLISLQEAILKELRRDQKVTVRPEERKGKGPFAGVSWEEHDRMRGRGP